MRVKAKVNESKLTFVHAGQAARIVIDAFADRPLKGKVSSVTAINTPLNASDVRIYYANVDITEGFADLRPGLARRWSSWSTPGGTSLAFRCRRSAGSSIAAMSPSMTLPRPTSRKNGGGKRFSLALATCIMPRS